MFLIGPWVIECFSLAYFLAIFGSHTPLAVERSERTQKKRDKNSPKPPDPRRWRRGTVSRQDHHGGSPDPLLPRFHEDRMPVAGLARPRATLR